MNCNENFIKKLTYWYYYICLFIYFHIGVLQYCSKLFINEKLWVGTRLWWWKCACMEQDVCNILNLDISLHPIGACFLIMQTTGFMENDTLFVYYMYKSYFFPFCEVHCWSMCESTHGDLGWETSGARTRSNESVQVSMGAHKISYPIDLSWSSYGSPKSTARKYWITYPTVGAAPMDAKLGWWQFRKEGEGQKLTHRGVGRVALLGKIKRVCAHLVSSWSI